MHYEMFDISLQYINFSLMNALVIVDIVNIHQDFIGKNKKVVWQYIGFRIPKTWQILKHFTRSFHQA